MLSLNLLIHQQELLSSASRAQQRWAHVLSSTFQPNTAEIYSIDKCIYTVYAADQVAYDNPLLDILGRRE